MHRILENQFERNNAQRGWLLPSARMITGSQRVLFGILCLATALSDAALAASQGKEASDAVSSGRRTFNKDIAPILFKNCALCHRPEQAGPFSLLTYADGKKHAKQIVEVTRKRYMPPWLPEPGYGEFAGERRLSSDQIDIIEKWAIEGAAEGLPEDLPPAPKWSDGWQLGQPDLIVQMPEAYTLPAEGKDVYRNFVMHIPVSSRRFVRAVEFLPGNWKTVHHAFINVDETRMSWRLAEHGTPPGFEGMILPETARMPGGQLLGWQPGKMPSFAPRGLAWILNTNTDLVLQLHMHPTGKLESVQPSVGFYFTDEPPTNSGFRINLTYLPINIPAGVKDYVVEESYILPVDVQVLAVSPHTHYLGKQLEGYAILPDGSREQLLLIKDWDFNWQGDYRYSRPVFLSKGTTLVMRFSYDNSAENARNPSQPPRRVTYGLQTTDEMGELFFQVLPRNVQERTILAEDFSRKLAQYTIDYNAYLLRTNPNDAVAHTKVGRALVYLGRVADGLEHLRSAVNADPGYDKAHYELGFVYLRQNRLPDAKSEFETVIRLNPEDYQAHGSLGSIWLKLGRFEEAEACFRTALRLNPQDAIAQKNLERLLKTKASVKRANDLP